MEKEKVVPISGGSARGARLFVYYKMPLRPEVIGNGLSVRLAQIRYDDVFFGIEAGNPNYSGGGAKYQNRNPAPKDVKRSFEILSVCETRGVSIERFAALLDADLLSEKFALVLVPFDSSGAYPSVDAFRSALPIKPCRWAAYAVFQNFLTSFLEGN